MTDEIFVIDGEDMEEIKKYANKIIDILPADAKTSLMVISYLKQIMENTMNVKSDARIHYKDGKL